MSRHEGVSCDSCMKANFRGRRYKCLTCYDYDLCASCYEAGTTTTRHNADHAMQCILTRTDFDLYYAGEAFTAEQPQSFSCPYCGKMGFTETTLQEHVTADHAEASNEVVCPICAALPGGDPNLVTDDFTAHLTLEHRAPRDFQDEPLGGIRHVRRIQHPGRGMGGTRARRTFNFQSTAGLSGLSPNTRDTPMDPIAELLSQLSSVRSRAAAAQSVSSQLQQLEMQLQSTRSQQSRQADQLTLSQHGVSRHAPTAGNIHLGRNHEGLADSSQQLERLPRQRAEAVAKTTTGATPQPATILDFSSATSTASAASNANSQYLLARLCEPELTELEKQQVETDRADRSLFVQELLLSTLAEGLRLESTPSGSPSPEALSTPPPTPPSPSPQEPPPQAPTPRENPEPAASVRPNVRAECNEGAPAGRLPPRPKPSSAHRNMVKHKEAVRNSEKEPPPPQRVASKH